jgi:ABC-2 type transport system permease protein
VITVLSRISALARRDLRLELSYHFQLFTTFVSMALAVVTFYFLGRLVGNAEQLQGFRGGYFEFALLGLLVMGFSQACVNSFGRSIQSAQSDGTLEILLSTATRLPTLLTGTLVVPILFALVEAAMYLGVGWVAADLRFTLQGIGISAVLLVLTLGTFAALGILSATVIVLTKRGDPFSSLALQGSNLLAGAMFPITVMPEALQAVSRAVPAFYGLRGVRAVLLAGATWSDVRTDVIALVVFNIVMVPTAMWALSGALRIARRTGTLGNR